MLNKRMVVKTGVEHLINTLANVHAANVSKAEKINQVRQHAEYALNAINATLSLDRDYRVIKSYDISIALKITLASFKEAITTKIDTLVSTDRAGRRYKLSNMLERHLLLAIYDSEVDHILTRAFREKADHIIVRDNLGVHLISLDGSRSDVTKAVYQKHPRNPYTSSVLSL